MTSTMTVRRDQPRGQVTRAKRTGWRSSVPISLSGRVSPLPSPTSSVNIPLMLSPAAP